MPANLTAFLEGLLEANEHVTWWQAALRAAIVFVVAWALLRIAGRRAFAQKGSFDLCIALLLGATLSRAVIGATSMAAAVSASLVLVLLHRLIGRLSVFHPRFDHLVGGRPIELVHNGTVDREALKHGMISREDLVANVRANLQSESLDGIARVVLERDGKLSFVREDDENGK